MKPTEILSLEHRVIEQVLNCLEKIAERSIAERKLDGDSAHEAIDFFRNFADRCHHGKEEAHLFPAMEAKGFPRESGPTGVMIHEHEAGRLHVREMESAIDDAAQGNAKELKKFVEHAHAYLHLLREHINKEDHCLFSMANQAFTDEDQQHLSELFEHVEREEVGEGVHEKYLGIAHELAQKYGVPDVTLAAGSDQHSPCCHHH